MTTGCDDAAMAGTCRLSVDLDALNRNVGRAAVLAGDREVLVAVKADAYGHGLVPVARSIEASGSAQWLGVATVAEATALRAAGISLPILKFSATLPHELSAALAADVVFTVADEEMISCLAVASATAGVTADVHIEVDTGMRRIGADPEDVLGLARLVADSPHLRLGGIYTHLPISDSPEGDEFTQEAFGALSRVVRRVEEAVGPVDHVHAANSGAVLGHDLAGTTMVRPGIMAYGSHPDPGARQTIPLEAVARWTSRLLFIQRIRAGETVGYGRSWTAAADTWIGTVAVGYGDGYSRSLSNRGRMLVDGTSRPIVGRVCMDLTMIDLGPATPTVRVGDEAVLMGSDGDDQITVDEIANLMGTIPYEVTCLISARVPRCYTGEFSPSSTS